jgi:protein TonB
MKRAAALFLIALLCLPFAVQAAAEAKPKVAQKVDPEYTAEAKEARVEGQVVLDLTVGAAGNVKEVKVVERLSHGLTESAVDAVRQWKFEPRDGGKNVVVRITLRFALS